MKHTKAIIILCVLCAIAFLTKMTVKSTKPYESTNPYVRTAVVATEITDQALLTKIALKDKYPDVRQAAVDKLTDQAVLAKIAVRDESREVRRAAVYKLTDQALLAKVAVDATDTEVRRAAVNKLTDQALLVNIALEATDTIVRSTAIRELTDPAVLAQVAVQAVLAKIAAEDKDAYIREAAFKKLTDQALLAKVSTEARFLNIRVAAIDKVSDQALLRQWAEKDPQAAIRQVAAVGIKDDGFLLRRLPLETSASVRTAIIKTLHGKDSVRTVALTAYNQENRELALQSLKEKFKDPAIDVGTTHTQLKSQVTSLATETDNAKLLALALKGNFDVLRSAAASRLSDPVVLEQVATRADDRAVLKIVLSKLADKEILNRLASTAVDLPLRLAVAQKAGAKSWKNIFDAATARGAGEQSLGDALAAASLFPAVQTDAVYGVQQACLNLIRWGNESRIPEMVDLLEGYGDKTLGEDYLNCGQPDLDTAGRAWANKRGYNIGTGNGSSRARWGSGM